MFNFNQCCRRKCMCNNGWQDDNKSNCHHKEKCCLKRVEEFICCYPSYVNYNNGYSNNNLNEPRNYNFENSYNFNNSNYNCYNHNNYNQNRCCY